MNESNHKHSGLEAPVKDQLVSDDEETVKLPDGQIKVVRKYTLEKYYFKMTDSIHECPAQIPIRQSRLNYLLYDYSPREADRWIMFNHPNHFLIYDMNTKFCIYDAEYIDFKDQYEDPEPICAVITKITFNTNPKQHPSDIEDDFGTVRDLLKNGF